MLVSEYGELLNVKPMIKTKSEAHYREVQMIGDNTDSKTLIKKLNHSPNTYFLFDPKGHFNNAQSLYMSMKKHVSEKYYGRKGKRSKKPEIEGTNSEKKMLKGSAFEDC